MADSGSDNPQFPGLWSFTAGKVEHRRQGSDCHPRRWTATTSCRTVCGSPAFARTHAHTHTHFNKRNDIDSGSKVRFRGGARICNTLMHGSIPVCVRGVCVSVRLFHSQYMCACGQAGEAKGCLHARCLHATCVQMPACKMRACNRNACFNVLERETHRNRHTGGWSWAGDRHAPTACRGARQSQCTRHPLRQRTALFPPRLWAGPGITHTCE